MIKDDRFLLLARTFRKIIFIDYDSSCTGCHCIKMKLVDVKKWAWNHGFAHIYGFSFCVVYRWTHPLH